MYISEQLIEQGGGRGMKLGGIRGMKRGIERGKLEGAYEMSVKMIDAGQGIGFVAEITGISHKKLLELAKGPSKNNSYNDNAYNER